MPAVKSDNPLHAELNKTYNVHVYEWSTTQNCYFHAGICSANEVATYIGNEELKIKLFNEVLGSGVERCSKKIRNRLKIDFYLK